MCRCIFWKYMKCILRVFVIRLNEFWSKQGNMAHSLNSAILTIQRFNKSVKLPSPWCRITSVSSAISKRFHNDTKLCQLSCTLHKLVLLELEVIVKNLLLQWLKDLRMEYYLDSQRFPAIEGESGKKEDHRRP